MQVTSLSRCLIWAAAAAFAGLCQAQVMQPPGTMPGRQFPVPHHKAESRPPDGVPQAGNMPAGMAGPAPIHTGASASSPNAGALNTGALNTGSPNTTPNATPNARGNLPPSLLDRPAAPARVTLSDGSLSVDAHNSSLSEILKEVGTSSGMTVDGFGKDSRVFGVYGPGPPRDVLSSLLDGAGYNFLMVGATQTGAPREIVLTARSSAPISAPAPGSSQPDEDEEPQNNFPQAEPPPPPAQPPTMPPAEQRPRTPQEMLQELQRLRQQQMQQPQGQQPQGQPNPQ